MENTNNLIFQPGELFYWDQSDFDPSFLLNDPLFNFGGDFSSLNEPSFASLLHQQSSNGVIVAPLTNNNYSVVPQSIAISDKVPIEAKPAKKRKKKRKRVVDPNAPPRPKRVTGLTKPLLLSESLQTIMDGAKQLSRPEIVKKLWDYIKLNQLQDPADRRFILCDDKLKLIFQKDRVNSFGMNRDLSAHLKKISNDFTI